MAAQANSQSPARHVLPGSLARLVDQTRARLVEALDREMAQFDLSTAQYVVLSTLASGTADTAARICREISYNPGAMTRMLDRLEDKGMIRRARHAADRRVVKLELTKEGEAMVPSLRSTATAVVSRFFSGFDQFELRQLETLLGRMRDTSGGA